ncbi:hypothetical protein BOTBODRAFT_37911 [Botryobasidium botryosum FD-172 SS1]|uniref:NAD(+) diphosphatase n=1 Tax=Botryobasidium botryosum (strain FD-172 SS1) TaxID=930990 RepID=A0A067MA51_BOTB1|nr:hypothetical protein BOTBODRAFT_37911 [Botryobasidium botryosum FD-172 SS1]
MSPFTHFHAGSPLNRLSWLRSSPQFLTAALLSKRAQWVLFHSGNPLLNTTVRESSLARLSTAQVLPLLGPAPYFAQGTAPGTHASAPDHILEHAGDADQRSEEDRKIIDTARIHGPTIAFLGLDEREPELQLSKPEQAPEVFPGTDIAGVPWFALDVTEVESDLLDPLIHPNFRFALTRPGTLADFSVFDAALFSQGRSILDWNSRYKFCPACGSPFYSLWSGWKTACSTLLPWNAAKPGQKPCPSGKGLNNYTHPRTDIAIIVTVVDEAREKVLLGRGRRYPPLSYSALAGFLEPSETLEDAVRREIWEESGVKLGDVAYHSCQPWPYPSTLMTGFFASADSTKPINLNLDHELEDAKWFTREEVLKVLAHPNGVGFAPLNPKLEYPTFRIPPQSAIAGVMISQWARGEWKPFAGDPLSDYAAITGGMAKI